MHKKTGLAKVQFRKKRGSLHVSDREMWASRLEAQYREVKQRS